MQRIHCAGVRLLRNEMCNCLQPAGCKTVARPIPGIASYIYIYIYMYIPQTIFRFRGSYGLGKGPCLLGRSVGGLCSVIFADRLRTW